jgi:hypothetical protein
MKARKKRSSTNTAFRPGTSGECEGQLWMFTGPPGIPRDDHVPEIHWVAAESLDAALLCLRKRHDDFMIIEAAFVAWSLCSLAHPWTDRDFADLS